MVRALLVAFALVWGSLGSAAAKVIARRKRLSCKVIESNTPGMHKASTVYFSSIGNTENDWDCPIVVTLSPATLTSVAR